MMITKYLLALASVIKSLNWPEFEPKFPGYFKFIKWKLVY